MNQPIVVLSNNDGCVVARSNEAKALGIGMAVPFFQVRSLCKKHGVQVFSSNYTLYADLSARVMSTIESCCPDIEVYSIDEAFLELSQMPHRAPEHLATTIHQKVRQHIGIPVSIGIAPTKTLAKLANHIAKRKVQQPVFDLSARDQQAHWLPQLAIEDIWGVGRKLSLKLKRQGIHNAAQLRSANIALLRKQYGVVMERTVRELNGMSCHGLQPQEDKKNILSSKSFGQRQSEFAAVAQALSQYCARAVDKLRAQGSTTGHLTVFLRTHAFRQQDRQYHNAATVSLVHPSDDIRVITKAAKRALKSIFRKGYQYHKTGILLSNLNHKDQTQLDLFHTQPNTFYQQSEAIMTVIESVNSKFGNGTLALAAQGFNKPWQMQSKHRSQQSTTCWSQLPIVRAL